MMKHKRKTLLEEVRSIRQELSAEVEKLALRSIEALNDVEHRLRKLEVDIREGHLDGKDTGHESKGRAI